MTKPELMTTIRLYKVGDKTLEEVRDAVDAYSSASNDAKPPVSGSLPPHYHILLGQEARKYVTNIGEPINGLTELAFYNGGVFVISEWLGGK